MGTRRKETSGNSGLLGTTKFQRSSEPNADGNRRGGWNSVALQQMYRNLSNSGVRVEPSVAAADEVLESNKEIVQRFDKLEGLMQKLLRERS